MNVPPAERTARSAPRHANAATSALWLPPLVFGAATIAALVAELPELALALGLATAMVTGVALLFGWGRWRR